MPPSPTAPANPGKSFIRMSVPTASKLFKTSPSPIFNERLRSALNIFKNQPLKIDGYETAFFEQQGQGFQGFHSQKTQQGPYDDDDGDHVVSRLDINRTVRQNHMLIDWQARSPHKIL